MNVREHKELTITVAFDGMAAARAVVAALQAAGVDAARIAIGTDGALAAAPRLSASEAPLLWHVVWLGALWSIAGGVIGALVGLALGVYEVGVPGTPDNIAIQIASWAMFMHVAGALAGCYLALDTGDRFATTAHHHDARQVQIRVRAQHRAEYERALQVMRGGKAVD